MKPMTSNIIRLIPLLLFTLFAHPVQADETVYGWELMSEQERIEHRNTMQNLQTREERQKYMNEHHNMMLERAREKGVQLPDMPPQSGRGMMDGQGGPGGGRGR